jgi:hypothetical protein
MADFRGSSRLPRLLHFSRMTYLATCTVAALLISLLTFLYIDEHSFRRGHVSPPSSHVSWSETSPKPPPPVEHPATGSLLTSTENATVLVKPTGTTLEKPEGLKVVAVVFYGRRDRSSILECYLRQNLASNGGWLDEVIWAINTDNEEDIRYIETVAPTVDGYRAVRMRTKGYGNVYIDTFHEKSTIYVKIDDDVVYVEDNAIPRMVTSLLQNPSALMVSANVINSPALSWWQYHLDNTLAYLPEVIPDKEALSTRGNGVWRSSELPTWNRSQSRKDMPEIGKFYQLFDVADENQIPKHRWLPTRNATDIFDTPIARTNHDTNNNLVFWPMGAQTHYSFLENLEAGQLGRYYMDHKWDRGVGATWNMRGKRLSINFMAIRGADVLDNLKAITEDERGDDEHELTVVLPERLKRRKCFENFCPFPIR